ncbi:MAG: hypothetical protein ACOY4K_02495 [Pseudomonadota bacterium]
MKTPAQISLTALVLLGAINLVRGGVHVFLPDSGAGTIAGFDLENGGRGTIVLMLAFIGAGQLGQGLADLLAAWRYRDFVVPLLVVEFARNLLGMWIALIYKPVPTDYPGEPGLVAATGATALVLAWEFGRRLRRAD